MSQFWKAIFWRVVCEYIWYVCKHIWQMQSLFIQSYTVDTVFSTGSWGQFSAPLLPLQLLWGAHRGLGCTPYPFSPLLPQRSLAHIGFLLCSVHELKHLPLPSLPALPPAWGRGSSLDCQTKQSWDLGWTPWPFSPPTPHQGMLEGGAAVAGQFG